MRMICLFMLVFILAGCQDKEKSSFLLEPNILFAIADDQSYPYASAYGSTTLQTPAFDGVAQRGVLFNQAFCAAPQCSPSRAAILTGRNIWQLEEAGTHSSYFPRKYPVFTDALEAAGYALGYTGKPWGPGNWKDAGWDRNPVGPAFNEIQADSVPFTGIRKTDYAANFAAFLAQKNPDQPFFFWYGCHEPHRSYEAGSGIGAGKALAAAEVPDFLPNHEVIRRDVLDYAVEIEWFDQHLGRMIQMLEEAGELENTLIVVTADNGMPFPYAKANLQEYGTHVPLAIAGPRINGGRVVDDLVSLIDLAPTFLELTGTPAFEGITGKSLMPTLNAETSGIVDTSRTRVLTGRERHTHARPDNLGYPARAIRTHQYLYIQNLKPDRWPAGDPPFGDVNAELPQGYKPMKDGYHDIDASPSKSLLIDTPESWPRAFKLAVAMRPAEELFDIRQDPGCTQNLAGDPQFEETKVRLKAELETSLTEQQDPRMLGRGDVFESYPRFGGMRTFPGFRERGVYNSRDKE